MRSCRALALLLLLTATLATAADTVGERSKRSLVNQEESGRLWYYEGDDFTVNFWPMVTASILAIILYIIFFEDTYTLGYGILPGLFGKVNLSGGGGGYGAPAPSQGYGVRRVEEGASRRQDILELSQQVEELRQRAAVTYDTYDN